MRGTPSKEPELDPCACESVCSLPPDQLQRRARELRETVLPLVRGHDMVRDRVTWEFDDTPDTRRLLEEFVEFERSCCASLEFTLEPNATSLQLTIRGEGAELFSIES